MTTSAASDEANRLLELWEKLSGAHAMVGGGCSCGVGGVVVALEDFEQDIADYLVAETEKHGRADVLHFMHAHGRSGELWSIRRILLSLGDHGPSKPDGAATFILQRLGRTLQSFEKLHGGG